jgi:hypothetical protein
MNGEIVKRQFGGKLPSGNDEWRMDPPRNYGRKQTREGQNCVRRGEGANEGKADNSCCLSPAAFGEIGILYAICFLIWKRRKIGKRKLGREIYLTSRVN